MRVLEAVLGVPKVTSRVNPNPRSQAIFAQAMELSKGESIPIDCESEKEAVKLYNSLYLALYSRGFVEIARFDGVLTEEQDHLLEFGVNEREEGM